MPRNLKNLPVPPHLFRYLSIDLLHSTTVTTHGIRAATVTAPPTR